MTGRCPDLRVLHVVASTDRRGAEIAAVRLCEALQALGMGGSVVALTPGSSGGLEVPTLGPSRYARHTLAALRHQAKGHSAVLAHGSSTLPAVAAATIGTSTPFVYRSIGDPAAWLTTPARRARVRVAVRRASGLVALWRQAAVAWHRTLGVRAEHITVIPNGVSGEEFLPASGQQRAETRAALGLGQEGPVVMYLGALSHEKRIDLAIQAVCSIAGATLAVVGEGPERERLESMVAGSEARVRMVGPTQEPWRALAAADAVVLPSDTEGQPAVAIEAGLMGIPVVATRVGGLPDIVIDGRSGELVEAGDARALAGGLRQVLDRPEHYSEFARAHCLEHFALDRIAEKWAVFLQSVIKTGAIPEQHSD